MRARLWFTVLVVSAAARSVVAADPPRESGLDLVPSTAFGFVTVRVSDLNTVDALKPVRDAIGQLEKAQAPIHTIVGVPVSEIERVTLFWPTLPGDESAAVPVLVVTTAKPFNEARVLKALNAVPASEAGGRGHRAANWIQPAPRVAPAARPKLDPAIPGSFPPGPGGFSRGPDDPFVPPTAVPKGTGVPPGLGPTPRGLPDPKFDARGGDEPKADAPPRPAEAGPEKDAAPDLYFMERKPFPAVFLLDDRTLVFLPDTERGGLSTHFGLVGQLLRRKTDGPLAEALADAGKHTAAAGVRLAQVESLFRDDFPRELVPFRSLLRARVAAISADVGARATVTARLTFADPAQARRAEPVLKTLIQLGTDTLAEQMRTFGKHSEWATFAVPLMELASAALDKAEVRTDGVAVVGRVEAEFAEPVKKAVAGFPQLMEAAGAKTKTMNNLKQIAIAIHTYHDTNGHFPADVLDSRTGKPIWSWRVYLLPYLEQDNLYKRLDLTKPWDDPVNAKVLETMPDVFRVYGRDPKEKGTTFLQMPTTAFPPMGPFSIHLPGQRMTFASIADGTSNTLMVVEAAEAVPWAKPADLRFDLTKRPAVGSADRKWFYVAFADGSVRTLRKDKLTDEQLRALMTINGGEIVTIDE
jgi:hypothetical protein